MKTEKRFALFSLVLALASGACSSPSKPQVKPAVSAARPVANGQFYNGGNQNFPGGIPYANGIYPNLFLQMNEPVAAPVERICANPAPLDQVNDSWELLDSPALVANGRPLRYDLLFDKIQSILTTSKGSKASIGATIVIANRNGNGTGVTLKVDCRHLADLPEFVITTHPEDSISAIDGSVVGRRNVKIMVENKTEHAEALMAAADEDQRFGVNDENTLSFIESEHARDVSVDFRVYRVSSTQIEIRRTTTRAIKAGGTRTITINEALRYVAHEEN